MNKQRPVGIAAGPWIVAAVLSTFGRVVTRSFLFALRSPTHCQPFYFSRPELSGPCAVVVIDTRHLAGGYYPIAKVRVTVCMCVCVHACACGICVCRIILIIMSQPVLIDFEYLILRRARDATINV